MDDYWNKFVKKHHFLFLLADVPKNDDFFLKNEEKWKSDHLTPPATEMSHLARILPYGGETPEISPPQGSQIWGGE